MTIGRESTSDLRRRNHDVKERRSAALSQTNLQLTF